MSEPEQLSGGGYLRLVLLGGDRNGFVCCGSPLAAGVLRT